MFFHTRCAWIGCLLELAVLWRCGLRRRLKASKIWVVPELVEETLPIILNYFDINIQAALKQKQSKKGQKNLARQKSSAVRSYSPPWTSCWMELYMWRSLCLAHSWGACLHIRPPGPAPAGQSILPGQCESLAETTWRGTFFHARPPTVRWSWGLSR